MERAISDILIVQSVFKGEDVDAGLLHRVLDLILVDFGDDVGDGASEAFPSKSFGFALELDARENGVGLVTGHRLRDDGLGDVRQLLVGIGFVDVEKRERVGSAAAPALQLR